MAISQIPALTAHISFLLKSSTFGRLVLEHPPFKWQFHRFLLYSESSYLVDQVLGNLPPFKWQFHRFPALTAHISFLLWELNIWQNRAWHIYPSFKWQFHRFLLWLLIFLTYSDSSTFGRLVLEHPPFKWQFHRFLLYSESSYLVDQDLGNLPPFKWQFHRFHVWLLIFHSCSETSTFGRTGLGTSTPLSNGNFTDSCSGCSYFLPTLRAQNLADKVLEDLPTLSNINFRNSCPTLVAHIWQMRSWKIYSHFKWQFQQIPALTTHISFLLKSSTFGRPGLGRSPPFKWQFHRFLLYSESSYLADQVLGNLPPIKGNFTDSCSDCSYFFPTVRAQHLAGQGLAHLPLFQMAISQIHGLLWELIFGRWGLGRSISIPNGNFSDSCSDCSYFHSYSRAQHLADQVLADLPPLQMAFSHIPALLWEFIFGRPSVGKSTPPL